MYYSVRKVTEGSDFITYAVGGADNELWCQCPKYPVDESIENYVKLLRSWDDNYKIIITMS